MSIEIGYIYIKNNEWYESVNIYEIGFITDDNDLNNNYERLYKLKIKKSSIHLIYNLLHSKFKHYNVYENYYNRCIINELDNFFKKYNIQYLINNKQYIYDKYYKLVSKIINDKLKDYQIMIISHIISLLKSNNRCYLHLATGAGKCKITFNVITTLKPLNILIFSPRINLKIENMNDKYLQILKDYKLFNNDNGNIKNYNIINYCYQSCKNAYEIIIKNDIRNLFVWFDESQHIIDNWINNPNNDYKKFFMNDNNFIVYRLFTSANSNREFIAKNANIYGILYEPIKFKELQDNGYLAKIKIEIFDKEYDNMIVTTFNKQNNERKMGISFYNNCINAYNAYLLHLKLFKENKTDIKPYLLINEEIIKNQKDNIDNEDNYDINHKDDLKIIKKIKKELKNINYHTEIYNFEKEIENKQKVIGYQVAKYATCYNNDNIDILYFIDIKLSYKDVIKSIDRGTKIKDNKYLRIILLSNMIIYNKIHKYIIEELELNNSSILIST